MLYVEFVISLYSVGSYKPACVGLWVKLVFEILRPTLAMAIQIIPPSGHVASGEQVPVGELFRTSTGYALAISKPYVLRMDLV